MKRIGPMSFALDCPPCRACIESNGFNLWVWCNLPRKREVCVTLGVSFRPFRVVGPKAKVFDVCAG